ncbi:MAG: hypothetical protein JST16_11375 [Bdellovibrionales bacterium]|nr:hypothetical protein [Bdellovibrionales bacterium]
MNRKVSLRVTALRARLNALAEGRFRRILMKLEQVPPLDRVLLRARSLRWPALFIAGALVADLLMQSVGVFFAPSKPTGPTKPRVIVEAPYVKSLSTYETIVTRNAFCPGCPVPDMKVRALERPKDCNKATPISSGLKLIGTIVLSDSRFSVATVTGEGNDSKAIQVGDTVSGQGKVLEIKRNKVCFLRDDNSLGYIDLPEDALKLGQPLPQVFSQMPADAIQKSNDTNFAIKRSFVMEQISKPDLLFQASAAPATCADGSKGFKVSSINPGSLYESLGIQVGDCISGIDGGPMDFSKAQEAFANIRTRDSVSIDVIRGGNKVTLAYKITK